MDGDAGVCRYQNFIIHAPAQPIGARQKVRLNIYAVSGLAVVDFNFVRMEGCTYDDSIIRGRLTEIDP